MRLTHILRFDILIEIGPQGDNYDDIFLEP